LQLVQEGLIAVAGHGFTGYRKTIRLILKGRGFSRAEQVLYSCHFERASAREKSAFQPFSAACESRALPRSLLPVIFHKVCVPSGRGSESLA
jgi:hypothetical protein